MGFASGWLNERALFPEFINEAPDKNTGIIVVVPSFDEPGITVLLDSLAACNEPECRVEVIIVINAPADAGYDKMAGNELTIKNIESWKMQHMDCFFRLFVITADTTPFAKWGVGMARKTGMDEAVRRFSRIDEPEGTIICLDADCRVKPNYFTALFFELYRKKERRACSVYFEHPFFGDEFPSSVYKYIALYELHLRYYLRALVYAGYPDAFHTVGSSMAVKALQYVRVGGMNRKQAGEDFYFIQKLVAAGGYFSLNTTTVYPSPRISSRVPFGTGASIGKLTSGNDPTLLSYNIKAFEELRTFFGLADQIFKADESDIAFLYGKLPSGLRSFMGEGEWIERIMEIRNNTSGYDSFRKRFFGWFNMFRIVKYLNHVHNGLFEKIPVIVSASELLTATGIKAISNEAIYLAELYRILEKDKLLTEV
jgi:hypothetical protein